MLQLFVVLPFFSLISVSNCHIRFVCPRPQSPDSSLGTPPCGGGTKVPFNDSYTDVWPGLFTIKLEEPIIKKNSPMKVSLMDYDDPSLSCVLLDHVPHNYEARNIDNCSVTEYPVGGCNTPTYLTVRIPDIRCPRCVLQVIQISPEADNKCRFSNGKFDCPTYYTCSNIKIRPTSQGSNKDISSCRDYFSSLKSYPFAEVAIYEKKMIEPFLGSSVVFHDSNGHISYKLGLTKGAPHVSGVALFSQQTSGLPFYTHFKRINYYNFVGVLPPYSATKFREAVQINQCWLRLTYVDKIYRVIAYRVEFKTKRYVKDEYTKEGLQYDGNHMIKHTAIVGPEAVFREMALPCGKCAPDTRTWGAVMYTKKTSDPRGLVLFQWTGRNMHLFAILGKRRPALWEVEFKAPEVISSRKKSINIPKNVIKNNTIEASLPIWEFALFAGGPPTTVTALDRDIHLQGTINDTIMAVLRNSHGELKGLAMLTPIKKKVNLLRIVVVIDSYQTRTPRPMKLTLNGPATSSTSGPVIFDLLTAMRPGGFVNGVWVSDGEYPVEDETLVMHLWNGDLYVHVVGIQSRFNLRGQFEPLTTKFCVPALHVICQTCLFGPTDDKLIRRDLPITGRATFHFNKKHRTFDATFHMEGLRPDDKITDVHLYNKEIQRKRFDVSQFRTLPYRSRTQVASIQIKRDIRTTQYIQGGLFQLFMEVTRYGDQANDVISLVCAVPVARAPPTFPTTKIKTTTPLTTTTTTTTESTSTTTKTTTTTKMTYKTTLTTAKPSSPVTSPSVSTKSTDKLLTSTTTAKPSSSSSDKIRESTVPSDVSTTTADSTTAPTMTTAPTTTTMTTAPTTTEKKVEKTTTRVESDTRPRYEKSTTDTTTKGAGSVLKYGWLSLVLSSLLILAS